MLNVEQIAGLAREIAAERAFTYAGNGGRGEFTYTVSVTVAGEALHLSADCNARITEKRASAELSAVWEALIARLDSETIAAHKVVKSRGFKVWRYGFFNMGRFCTEGFRRGLAPRSEAGASAEAAE